MFSSSNADTRAISFCLFSVTVLPCLSCNTLDDSPLYQVLKNVDYSDSPVSRNFINAQLTIQIHDWEQIDIELVKKFKQLNETGKAIAIERVGELAETTPHPKRGRLTK